MKRHLFHTHLTIGKKGFLADYKEKKKGWACQLIANDLSVSVDGKGKTVLEALEDAKKKAKQEMAK